MPGHKPTSVLAFFTFPWWKTYVSPCGNVRFADGKPTVPTRET